MHKHQNRLHYTSRYTSSCSLVFSCLPNHRKPRAVLLYLICNMEITYVEQMKQLFSLFSLLSKVQCNTKIDLENLKPLFFVCICQNMFIYSYRLKENVLYFEACPADLFGSTCNYSVLSFLLFRTSLMNVKNG